MSKTKVYKTSYSFKVTEKQLRDLGIIVRIVREQGIDLNISAELRATINRIIKKHKKYLEKSGQ